MITIKIENKIIHIQRKALSLMRSLFLFANPGKIKFGKGVRLIGEIKFGNNVSLQDNTKIQGRNINICDDVFIHENVFLRGKNKIIIGQGTTVNRNTSILDDVIIGKYCSIAPNCVIVGSNHNYADKNTLIKEQGSDIQGIIIEDDVWIGANATILDGVHIGKGAVVAAGAVVNKSVEPYTVVGGIPAKMIGQRF